MTMQPFATTSRAIGHTGIRHDSRPLMVRLIERFVVAEHRCSVPGDARSWAAINPDGRNLDPSTIYMCPECHQRFIATSSN